MKSLVVTLCVMAFVALATGCSSSWQKDCSAFVQTMTDLASKTNGSSIGGYGDDFKGKEITWNLKFKEIEGENLQFDLEPFGVKYVFFSGKPVMMGFKSAPGTSEVWKTTTPGSQVKISGVVGNVIFIRMSPGNNPGKEVPAAVVTIENVKRVQD